MSAKSDVNIVVNAPAASGADLTRPGNGRVFVTGDTSGFLRPKVKNIAIKPFLVETLADLRVTASASPAANTTYRFIIEQQTPESLQNSAPKQYTVEVFFTTAPSATVFANTVTAAVQAYIDSGELSATATAYTSGNGGVDIAGVAGSGLVSVKQPINMTVASQLASGSSTSTDFSGVAATGVLTAEVASTAAFEVGQLHKITWTGNSETINGRTGTQGAIVRVIALLSGPARVQYQAESVSADFTGDDCTYELLATEERGLGSDLTSERGIVGSNDAIVATNVYHEVVVDYQEPSGSTMTVEDGAPIQKRYFIDATTSAANATALLTQFEYVDQYLDSAGSAVDPLLL